MALPRLFHCWQELPQHHYGSLAPGLLPESRTKCCWEVAWLFTALCFYGLDYATGNSTGYTEGTPWHLYSAYLDNPQLNDTWEFEIADPTPLHTVTAYEESNSDVHALHDFFETVIAPDGSWMGIAYQRNVDQHPFEENEEQRYIMFVRGELALDPF